MSKWVLFQTDDPDYECEEDRMKATAEEWLVEFDKGSNIEDSPHRLEPEHGTSVYRIVTAGDEICCRVRDITKTCHSSTDAESNRWIEGEPSSEKPDNVIKFPG